MTKATQAELLADFILAVQLIRDPQEVLLFIQDMFTKAEVLSFAKRLRIAKSLLENKTFREIETDIHVSHATIAKLAVWLKDRGEGLRRVVSKLPKVKKREWSEVNDQWKRLMERNPRYFWPELFIEKLGEISEAKEKEKLKNLLDSLQEKREIHKEIEQTERDIVTLRKRRAKEVA